MWLMAERPEEHWRLRVMIVLVVGKLAGGCRERSQRLV